MIPSLLVEFMIFYPCTYVTGPEKTGLIYIKYTYSYYGAYLSFYTICQHAFYEFVDYLHICDHLRASTEIHFLPVQERYIHALSRNTNCLTIDGRVCFYRRPFTDAVKPQGCISWSWGTLIGLHGVPNCSSRQSWPPLWIVSVHVTY